METWFVIGLAVLLVPAVLYAVACYTLIWGDLIASKTRGQIAVRTALVNGAGPLLGVAVYLLVLGGPFLGTLALIDKITDA